MSKCRAHSGKCILIIPRVSPEDLFETGAQEQVYKITATAESSGSVFVCRHGVGILVVQPVWLASDKGEE